VIPGLGPTVATALVAEVGDWKQFRSGRNLAAWIGLVPQAAFDRRQEAARQHHQAALICASFDASRAPPSLVLT
jgi:transposase